MTRSLAHDALRRKIAAHQPAASAAAELNADMSHVFGRALRRAAMPFDGLGLTLGPIAVQRGQPLQAAAANLPEQGLVAAVEDEHGLRGLIGLSAPLIDALIEVQTTGRVEAMALPPRPVTRIDEALSRDFIDLLLSAMAQEGQKMMGRDWPDRMSYGSRIADRSQINLLLPDRDYVMLQGEVGFDAVTRRAHVVLIMPRLAAVGLGSTASALAPVDPSWVGARERMIAALPLPLDAVLMRLHHPLAQVERLAVGDLFAFGPADLQAVTLVDLEGRVLAHGRLGQAGGRRALRVQASDARAANPAPSDPMTELSNHS